MPSLLLTSSRRARLMKKKKRAEGELDCCGFVRHSNNWVYYKRRGTGFSRIFRSDAAALDGECISYFLTAGHWLYFSAVLVIFKRRGTGFSRSFRSDAAALDGEFVGALLRSVEPLFFSFLCHKQALSVSGKLLRGHDWRRRRRRRRRSVTYTWTACTRRRDI